jgi:hypothetical protein
MVGHCSTISTTVEDQEGEIQVRRAILTGAILVSAIGVALGTGIPAASAQSFPVNVCIPSGGHASQCMNDWNGNLTSGAAAVRFYHYGNSRGFNAIDVQYVGTIDRVNGGFQPFSNGSNLNVAYNGRPVYKFAWWRNGGPSGTCIAGYSYNANSFNEGCNVSSGQNQLWFVMSSYGALISVGSSNLRYLVTGTPNNQVWIGSNGKGNIGNGDNVYLTTIQNNNLPWDFFTDGG